MCFLIYRSPNLGKSQKIPRTADSAIKNKHIEAKYVVKKLKTWSTQAWTSSAPAEALQLLVPSASGYMLFQVGQYCKMNDKS